MHILNSINSISRESCIFSKISCGSGNEMTTSINVQCLRAFCIPDQVNIRENDIDNNEIISFYRVAEYHLIFYNP